MYIDILAGWVGGVAGVLVGHPLDTIKVNIQVKSSQNSNYNGIIATFNTLLRQEGIKGLYRGVTSPLVGLAGINAITFGVFFRVEESTFIKQRHKKAVVAGGLAGLAGSFLLGPIELAKSRMQIAGPEAGSCPLHAMIKIYNSEGFKAMFRGTGVTIAREIPANMVFFSIYDFITQSKENSTTLIMLLAGGVAGVVSWVLPYPVDVIKTKIQVDGLYGKNQYKNSLDCLKQTIKLDGYRGLYHGLLPTILRAFPVNAVTFTVVTWTRKILTFNEEPTKSSDVSYNISGKSKLFIIGTLR